MAHEDVLGAHRDRRLHLEARGEKIHRRRGVGRRRLPRNAQGAGHDRWRGLDSVPRHDGRRARLRARLLRPRMDRRAGRKARSPRGKGGALRIREAARRASALLRMQPLLWRKLPFLTGRRGALHEACAPWLQRASHPPPRERAVRPCGRYDHSPGEDGAARHAHGRVHSPRHLHHDRPFRFPPSEMAGLRNRPRR